MVEHKMISKCSIILSRESVIVLMILLGGWINNTSLCCAAEKTVTGHIPPIKVTGKLPETGQESCYNDTAEISCPKPGEPYYGQDGNYTTSPMSLINNGNGTITDKITGLIWQSQDDGINRNWKDSSLYCGDLKLGGYEDWRLPTRREMISIIDYGRSSPAIDPTVFPGTKRGWYWTSSSRAVDPLYAWSVFSANGRFHGSHKSGGGPLASPGRVFGGLKSGDFYVRCVRGKSP